MEGQITLPQRLASACVGSGAVAALMTPLDVVKVRLQAQIQTTGLGSGVTPTTHVHCQHYQFSNGIMDHLCRKVDCPNFEKPVRVGNPLRMAVYIVQNEGVGALWSGLRPTLVMAIPANVMYFATYDELNERLLPHAGGASPLVAGSAARIFAATAVAPLELVRTQIQSEQQSRAGFTRRLRALARLPNWRQELFRGLEATLLRDVPFSALYWYMYENLGARLERDTTLSKPLRSFAAGAAAGTTAAFVTTPFDVVKTKKQVRQLSSGPVPPGDGRTVSILRGIWAAEGLRGLFAGVGPRCARIAPSCAIMISSYEMGKLYFSHRTTPPA